MAACDACGLPPEVLHLRALPKTRRKPAARPPFRAPLWDDDHPAFRRIDASLPADHHARWFVTVLAHLDLTAFRLRYAGYGSLVYPVELLLAVVLFLYAEGELSPAAWARKARYDDQCQWLLRGLQPSRSPLYAFRDRVAPFLDGWHQQLLRWAVAAGLTRAAQGSRDGTFVAALASRQQLLSPHRVARRLLRLQLLVGLDAQGHADRGTCLADLPELALTALRLWLELLNGGLAVAALEDAWRHALAVLELLCPAAGTPGPLRLPTWVPHSVAGHRRGLQRYAEAPRRLAQRWQPYQRKAKLSKKDQAAVQRLKVSLTDPEAALGGDKAGTYRPLDNVPLVQALDAPLTLAWDVLPRNNDDGLRKPMLAQTAAHVGHPLEAVLVDGAFVSVGEVVWCEQQGTTVYAPPRQARVAKAAVTKAAAAQATPASAAASTASAGGAAPAAKLPKEAFRYDRVEQVYDCPQGKRLAEAFRTTEQRHSGLTLPVIVPRASGQDCQGCPQQQGCTSNPQKGRVVKRYEGEEALARLEQRMAEPASQRVCKQRCRSVELAYADLKEHRGLREFRCFGRKRARAQAGLVILASNGLKVMAALQRRHEAAQALAPPEKQPA